VKPKISTFTPHLSNVLDKISAHIAATEIGLPLIDPELSINLQENNGRRAIEILHKGKTLVVGQYPIPEIAEWDVYSDDTSEDFFYWLTKTKNQNQ